MIADKLQTLINTKAAIKAAIQAKGVTIPDDTPFSAYPSLIASIQSGGGGLYDSLSVLGYDEDTIAELNEMRDEDIQYSLAKTDERVNNDNNIVYLKKTDNMGWWNKPYMRSRTLRVVPDFGKIPSNGFAEAFSDDSALVYVPDLDTSDSSDFSWVFNGCLALRKLPNFDYSSGTLFISTCQNCESLKDVPVLNLPVAYNTKNMFNGCSSLVNITIISSNTWKLAEDMFKGCSKLISVSITGANALENISYMFNNCSSLIAIPQLNTAMVTYATGVFFGCTSLTTIPVMDFSSMISAQSAFQNCTNLTDVGGFVGVKCELNFTNCTKLTHDSLMNIIYGLGNVSSVYLYLGATNLAKLSDIEKNIAVNKGWILQ